MISLQILEKLRSVANYAKRKVNLQVVCIWKLDFCN